MPLAVPDRLGAERDGWKRKDPLPGGRGLRLVLVRVFQGGSHFAVCNSDVLTEKGNLKPKKYNGLNIG